MHIKLLRQPPAKQICSAQTFANFSSNSKKWNSTPNPNLKITNPTLLLIESCDSMSQAKQIQAHTMRTGLFFHLFPVSRLLSFIALDENGDFRHANVLFSQILEPNVYVWNTIIRGCVKNGFHEKGFRYFVRMVRECVEMDKRSYVFGLKACVGFEDFRVGHSVQCRIWKVGSARDVIIKNGLIHFYCESGNLVGANKIFRESGETDVVSWTSMINGNAINGMADEALKLFDEMCRSGVDPNEVTMVTVVSACAKKRDLRVGERIHEFGDKNRLRFSLNVMNAALDMYAKCGALAKAREFFDNMEVKDVFSWTSMIDGLAKSGDVESAREFFDKMPERNVISWNAMIAGYSQNNKPVEALGLYDVMARQGLKPIESTLVSVLSACAQSGHMDIGKRIHDNYVKQKRIPLTVILGNAFVDMYAKCGRIDIACKVFERIWDRNVVCWTSMIVGYVQNDCAKEGLLLFNRMRNHLVEGNSYTLCSVVTACTKLGALHQGKWVHGFVIKNGIELNSCLVTSLLDMYVKCGAIRDARLIFDECSTIDLVLWTAMIVGYSQSGYADEALVLFTNKKCWGVSPNSVTLASVLSACAQSGNFKMGSATHGLGIKVGMDDANVTNALVDMYAKCNRMQDAVYLFDSMVEKDVISWNSIIGGYSKNSSGYEALRLFKRMRSNIFHPDPVTMVALLSACASLGDIRFGSSLHAYSIKQGFLASSNVYVGTTLLDLYAKSGDAKSARIVFDEMAKKNAVTWGAMIGGYGKQGDLNKCIELFDDMAKNLEPTGVIFTTILSACSHSGMISEGWRCFDSMCRLYNLTPSMKHYVSMVDLLARSGRLEEALEFIEKMPIQPDTTVFGAFLHGCSVHSRFDLGDVAVKTMLKMHPHDAPHYVLLSNLFASNGRWSEASQIRDSMKKNGLRKSPGSSQVGLHINEIYPQKIASFG